MLTEFSVLNGEDVDGNAAELRPGHVQTSFADNDRREVRSDGVYRSRGQTRQVEARHRNTQTHKNATHAT